MSMEQLESPIFEQFMLHVKEDMTEIKTLVRATNGRVRGLEQWRSYTMGAITVIAVMVLPMFIWFLQGYLINK